MIKDKIIKKKLKKEFEKINLSEEEKNDLVIEINILAQLLIKSYLENEERNRK